MSYNEDRQKVGTIRHIFLPQPTGLIYEVFLSALALFLISLSFIGKKLQETSPESDPTAYVMDTVEQGWILINQYHSAQQVMLFLAWAVFGMAVYVLLFKVFQLIYGTIYQLRKGVEYVHNDHAGGALKWLGSLHDIAFKLLIWVLGSIAIFLGMVVCFSFSVLQLQIAIADELPSNLLYFATAFVGALIGLRLVMIGLCFLLPSFRRWYTAG